MSYNFNASLIEHICSSPSKRTTECYWYVQKNTVKKANEGVETITHEIEKIFSEKAENQGAKTTDRGENQPANDLAKIETPRQTISTAEGSGARPGEIAIGFSANKVVIGALLGTILGLLGKRRDEPFNILYPIVGAAAGYLMPDSLVSSLSEATKKTPSLIFQPSSTTNYAGWGATILGGLTTLAFLLQMIYAARTGRSITTKTTTTGQPQQRTTGSYSNNRWDHHTGNDVY